MILTLILLIVGAGYLVIVRFWPYMACTRCNGGKLHQPVQATNYRHCPRCDGTGRTLRPSVVVMNMVGGRKHRIDR
jgi:DnaJ-class molecular chaperone